MRSQTPPDFAGRCRTCFLPEELCLCATIPRVQARTRLLVIRHVSEAWKASNTARWLALSVPGTEVVDYGDRERALERHLPFPEDAWLLFPDGRAPAVDAPPPSCLVVVDGTWSQARRMVHRHPALIRLPRMALRPPQGPVERLRTPPHPEGMSTLEAAAYALQQLEGPEIAAPLLDLHARAVTQGLRARGR